MAMKKAIGLVLLLSVVANVMPTVVTLDVTPAASGSSTGFNVNAAEIKTVTFDVDQGRYAQLMRQDLYNVVQKTTIGYVQGCPQLGKQKRVPVSWIHVVLNLKAKAKALSATVAIKPDNLYLAGFKAHDGTWFTFSNTGYLLPDAKLLSFRDDYKGLTKDDEGYAAMINVDVGHSATLHAASTLAQYKVGGAISEDEVRKALATLVLTLCEGQRFAVVQKNVTALWPVGGTVSKVGIDLLVEWADISCALIAWEKIKKKTKKNWDGIHEVKNIKGLGDPKIKDAKTALANINYVLSPTTCV